MNRQSTEEIKVAYKIISGISSNQIIDLQTGGYNFACKISND